LYGSDPLLLISKAPKEVVIEDPMTRLSFSLDLERPDDLLQAFRLSSEVSLVKMMMCAESCTCTLTTSPMRWSVWLDRSPIILLWPSPG